MSGFFPGEKWPGSPKPGNTSWPPQTFPRVDQPLSRSQARSALVPGRSQVDNESNFLGTRPHRQHPGILRLRRVQLPPALTQAAQMLLLRELGGRQALQKGDRP